jgi:leucyl aminopeptidase (aminopeptidase T)
MTVQLQLPPPAFPPAPGDWQVASGVPEVERYRVLALAALGCLAALELAERRVADAEQALDSLRAVSESEPEPSDYYVRHLERAQLDVRVELRRLTAAEARAAAAWAIALKAAPAAAERARMAVHRTRDVDLDKHRYG